MRERERFSPSLYLTLRGVVLGHIDSTMKPRRLHLAHVTKLYTCLQWLSIESGDQTYPMMPCHPRANFTLVEDLVECHLENTCWHLKVVNYTSFVLLARQTRIIQYHENIITLFDFLSF